jgi:membrane associated rhomboid family serine protease
MGRRGEVRSALSQARITRGALTLLFISAGLSLLYLLGTDELRVQMGTWLTATSDSVWGELYIWQVLTSPLLETQFISLLFQAFMLWMFMPALERWWGTRRFLWFAVYTSITGVLVGTLVGSFLAPVAGGHAISGLDPFIFAGIVAYGVLFSRQPVRFFGVLPMTGKQLTIGIVAFVGLFIVLGQAWAEGAAYASAMLVAFFMTSDKASPRLWLLKRKQKRIRRHLKLVRDGEDGDRKRWMN